MAALISLLNNIQQQARINNHRQILRLQGDARWCVRQAELLITHLQQAFFWLGAAPASITATHYREILGQETSLLIINALEQFDANAFAAGEGTLRGGGLLILLSPLAAKPNDRFYCYINAEFKLNRFITIKQDAPLPTESTAIAEIVRSKPLNTTQQASAVAAIIKTATGHRRRPLVLTANRGRGKSAALGIASAQLLEFGLKTILVCAPNKQASYTLFKHASLLLTGCAAHQFAINRGKQALQFIAPDALLADKPVCCLLIIDEAAALPVPTLEALVSHYSRVVFATTLHGYEGSGRGFALRFQTRLNEIAPQWRQCHLDKPIRWADKDPVENFTLNSLCLTQSLVVPKYNSGHPIAFEIVTQAQLVNDKNRLQAIFSLLVQAHYQTKPSDLAKLLNDTKLSIFVLTQESQLLGVALINAEGGFEHTITEQIWRGARRVQGHLIAQSLTFHSACRQAAAHDYARVQRIAIHPACQQQGLGKLLLGHLTAWAEKNSFDHICASFGATADLLTFWQQGAFSTLRIGASQDSSSGTHSAIVNLPLSRRAQVIHNDIQQAFQLQLPMQLSRHLQHIDSALVLTLLHEFSKNQSYHHSLVSYIEGNRPYEMVEHALSQLVINANLDNLSKLQQSLIIQKILQNESWLNLSKKHNYTGKKQAQSALKAAIRQLLTEEETRCD